MNTERLLHARAIMECVRDQKKPFYMGDWFACFGHENECNTAACFLGWCCRDKQFQAKGLTVIRGLPAIAGKRSLRGVEACASFFDITVGAAHFLVSPYEYFRAMHNISPRDVIRHIDAVLTGYEG